MAPGRLRKLVRSRPTRRARLFHERDSPFDNNERRFTIFNKGCSDRDPALIQAVFIGMLIQTQVEGTTPRSGPFIPRRSSRRVEEIYRRLLEGYAGIRILTVSDNPAIGRPFPAAIESHARTDRRAEGAHLRTTDRSSLGSI